MTTLQPRRPASFVPTCDRWCDLTFRQRMAVTANAYAHALLRARSKGAI